MIIRGWRDRRRGVLCVRENMGIRREYQNNDSTAETQEMESDEYIYIERGREAEIVVSILIITIITRPS
mgnify:CR=1 FL=1